jgi:hypothetical protein
VAKEIDIEAVAFDERDEIVVDKVGKAVRVAMRAREELQNAVAEAIDSSSTFGYELGVIDERHRVLDLMRETLSREEHEELYKKVENG